MRLCNIIVYMKKIITVLAAAIATVTVFSGCVKHPAEYEIYTNIPSELYELKLEGFKVAQTVIGNVSAVEEGGAAENPSAYKSMGITYYDIMSTEATIVVSEDFTDEEAAKARCTAFIESVKAKLLEIDKSLSVSVETSAVSSFNSAAAGAKIEIDEIAYNVFNSALEMYEFTEYYYNPAVYYSVEAYGFKSDSTRPETAAQLPSAEKIEKFKQLSTHFGEVKTYEEEGKFYVEKPQATVEIDGVEYSMKIDLGGIGKGYAVDVVNAMMDESGFKYGNFDFGSSSIACKSHYKNGAYNLGFRNPRPSFFDESYMSLKVKNECISTSGDDVQYYIIDGVRYCHVIDPTTGKPVNNGIMSATVIGGTAAAGDALTTALMAMGKDKALNFIESKLQDVKVAFTYENK